MNLKYARFEVLRGLFMVLAFRDTTSRRLVFRCRRFGEV
jgi:hypothetical protein